MEEPNFHSKVLSPEIQMKIGRFENANCFDTEIKELESP
jgi:hypothetical protein